MADEAKPFTDEEIVVATLRNKHRKDIQARTSDGEDALRAEGWRADDFDREYDSLHREQCIYDIDRLCATIRERDKRITELERHDHRRLGEAINILRKAGFVCPHPTANAMGATHSGDDCAICAEVELVECLAQQALEGEQ